MRELGFVNTWREQLDHLAAPVMFTVTLVYMLLLAAVLHVTSESINWPLFVALCLAYAVFPLELGVRLVAGSRYWRQYALFCLVPPLRLAARDQETGSTIWFPRMGWCEADDALFQTMEKAFSFPMIGVALLIVPLLGMELYVHQMMKSTPSPTFRMWLDLGTGLVWMAFAIEFFVMFSIAKKRVRYCKEHWLDVIIICLPMLLFVRLLRLGGLLRLQSLTRASRLYRLRGLALRGYRAIMLFDLVRRLIRGSDERHLERLEEKLDEQKVVIQELEEQICELKLRIDGTPARSVSEGQTPKNSPADKSSG
jgi:hypothetical protein